MNNTEISEVNEERFLIEDIVSYSNIEITHVNDNRAPLKVMTAKLIVWLLIAAMIASLFIM